MSTFIIAEAGVNHNGSIDIACQLIDVAASAGADAVKFQTFKTDELVLGTAKLATYQKENLGKDESQADMLRQLELSQADHDILQAHCQKKNIQFLSTPFDLSSVDFLCTKVGLKTIKVPSGELTNAPYLLKIAQYGVNVIISSGMAELAEIETALDVLAFGFLNETTPTSFAEIEGCSRTAEGQEILKEKVTLLHCTTNYPAPLETVNLRAMASMRKQFAVKVGLSDHSAGIYVPIAAVSLGATVVEKHFTLDRTMEGPDHKASLEPGELGEMVSAIRHTEIALGTGEKKPFEEELRTKKLVRKGLYAASEISAGQIIEEKHINISRPEDGLSPTKYWDIIGQKASRTYKKDEPLSE